MLNLERPLPYDLETEKVILGAILVHPPLLYTAQEYLKTDDFYLEAHRLIFDSMISLFRQSIPIEYIAVKNELQKNSKLEAAGGIVYLVSLSDGISRIDNSSVEYYAKRIKEDSVLRHVIQLSQNYVERGMSGEETSKQIIESMQTDLLAITKEVKSKGFIHAREFAGKAYSEIEKLNSTKEKVSGLTTGIPSLDWALHGLQKTQLYIIAGRPGSGKSAITQNIVDNLALRHGKSIGVFSLEMSGMELSKRTICAEVPLDSYDIPYRPLDWSRIKEVCESITDSNLYIDETSGITIMDLRSRAQRLALEHPIDLIVVDYLQLMSGSGARKGMNREQEISEISRGLKVLAKELDIPIIAIAQLNRAIEQHATRKPILSDLRESGAIEQDADVVLFIWREELRQKTEENEGKAELIIAKNRHGKLTNVDLYFDKKHCRFGEIVR